MKELVLIFTVLSLSCSPESKKPEVTMVYPSSDMLPENLLRMYIQFSKPMKTVGNLEKIRLLNNAGHELSGAIFNNVYELWSQDQTQLTLILDPARVKTGLIANDRLGRALRSGQTYELLINDLENINHQKIKPYIKRFHVVEADFKPPDIDSWKMTMPMVASKDPLRLIFSERVDQMSLHHRLVIVDENQTVVKGTIAIASKETEWHFFPVENWKEGSYSIFVNARLADPSGNNLNGLFDHRIDSLKYEHEGKILNLDFEISELISNP